MFFEPQNFISAKFLGTMGIGMLGVFMIVGIIILATYAINKLTSKKNSSEE